MDKLIAQLMRLYLMPGQIDPALLGRHLQGEATLPVDLAVDGMTRALVIGFDRAKHEHDGEHWTRLCEVAQALQTRCGFPAPGVSISAEAGFRLWLSFAAPVPAHQAQRFLEALRDAAFPELAVPHDAAERPVLLPPSRNERTGRWAAFIHPGMGASFVDEPGLEMAPPPLAQAAFLEQLDSISPAELDAALEVLHEAPAAGVPAVPASVPATAPAPVPASGNPGLLLRDATLEDIVRHLHALDIEPTFRHLLPGRQQR